MTKWWSTVLRLTWVNHWPSRRLIWPRLSCLAFRTHLRSHYQSYARLAGVWSLTRRCSFLITQAMHLRSQLFWAFFAFLSVHPSTPIHVFCWLAANHLSLKDESPDPKCWAFASLSPKPYAALFAFYFNQQRSPWLFLIFPQCCATLSFVFWAHHLLKCFPGSLARLPRFSNRSIRG